MENLTFVSLFLIGLSYGATACIFSCMPFLAPLLIHHNKTFKSSSMIVLPFSLGRVFTYTLIGGVGFLSSILIKNILNNNQIFQILLGSFTLIMGIYLFYKSFQKVQNSCKSGTHFDTNTKSAFGLFGIGALVSLTPCAPILTLITLSANSISLSQALLFGLSFGVGAILVPFVLYAFILSNILRGLLEEFKNFAKYIEYFGAILLISVGILVLFGKISL